MADQLVTTRIDDLMTYLNEKGETNLRALAAALGVSEAMVEAWVDVLEKANLVKINYRMGKMYIAPILKS